MNIQFMIEFITEIWIMIHLNSLQYFHMPYFTIEFNIMNSEFRLNTMNSYIWIHIFMNSYMNSEYIHLNSYTWIHILMNSYIHFIYEFRSTWIIWIQCIWIHICEFMHEFNYEFIWVFHIWIHMFHQFIYEFGSTKVPDGHCRWSKKEELFKF